MVPFHETKPDEHYLYDMAVRKGIPLHGSFELTPLCTMDCTMCFVRLSCEEQEARGELLTVEQWIALAEQLKKAGTLFLLLTGGEPLLYPGFRELYLRLRTMGFILMVNTNATLIDEGWADFFAENPPRRINITLYGANAENYAAVCNNPAGFEKTVRGIRLLKERGLPVKLSGSLIKANLNTLDEYIALCEELELPAMTETYMIPACRERFRPFDHTQRLSPDEYAEAKLRLIHTIQDPDYIKEDIQDTLEKTRMEHPSIRADYGFRCKAGKCSFAVNWKGYMRPCVLLHTPEIDVMKEGFSEAWNQITRLCASVQCDSKCISCAFFDICPRCPAAEHAETGQFGKAPAYLCDCMDAYVKKLQSYIDSLP